jgi:mitochondrial fission protein ELM1
MLIAEGFQFTVHTQQPAVDPASFDLVLTAKTDCRQKQQSPS